MALNMRVLGLRALGLAAWARVPALRSAGCVTCGSWLNLSVLPADLLYRTVHLSHLLCKGAVSSQGSSEDHSRETGLFDQSF